MTQYDSEMHFRCALHYSISNATYLPFPQDFFDAVFHFGGCNHFSDLKRAGAEFARVVKPGGTVVYGDESVAPWLRGTEFEAIVCTNNPLFRHELPLATIPECARDGSWPTVSMSSRSAKGRGRRLSILTCRTRAGEAVPCALVILDASRA
jgi:SAM-dependent methyltransferase